MVFCIFPSVVTAAGDVHAEQWGVFGIFGIVISVLALADVGKGDLDPLARNGEFLFEDGKGFGLHD